MLLSRCCFSNFIKLRRTSKKYFFTIRIFQKSIFFKLNFYASDALKGELKYRNLPSLAFNSSKFKQICWFVTFRITHPTKFFTCTNFGKPGAWCLKAIKWQVKNSQLKFDKAILRLFPPTSCGSFPMIPWGRGGESLSWLRALLSQNWRWADTNSWNAQRNRALFSRIETGFRNLKIFVLLSAEILSES